MIGNSTTGWTVSQCQRRPTLYQWLIVLVLSTNESLSVSSGMLTCRLLCMHFRYAPLRRLRILTLVKCICNGLPGRATRSLLPPCHRKRQQICLDGGAGHQTQCHKEADVIRQWTEAEIEFFSSYMLQCVPLVFVFVYNCLQIQC